MKRLLMGLMLVITAGTASAEWTFADANDDYIQYVDRATIRKSGNLVKMWGLRDFKTMQKSGAGDSYLSSKAQLEYDCKEEKARILAFSWFSGQMGNGNVVVSNFDTDIWTPIFPNSIGEVLWKIACGKK